MNGRVVIASIAVAAGLAAAAPPLTRTLEDTQSGVRLKYPATLVPGRQADPARPSDWRSIAMLVEPAQLPAGVSRDALPNHIPGIDIIETTGLSAAIQIGSMAKPESAQHRRTYAGHMAVKVSLPFGPSGAGLITWVVRIDNRRCLMVMAPNAYGVDRANKPIPTPYEEWVDAMLGSLSVSNPAK